MTCRPVPHFVSNTWLAGLISCLLELLNEHGLPYSWSFLPLVPVFQVPFYVCLRRSFHMDCGTVGLFSLKVIIYLVFFLFIQTFQLLWIAIQWFLFTSNWIVNLVDSFSLNFMSCCSFNLEFCTAGLRNTLSDCKFILLVLCFRSICLFLNTGYRIVEKDWQNSTSELPFVIWYWAFTYGTSCSLKIARRTARIFGSFYVHLNWSLNTNFRTADLLRLEYVVSESHYMFIQAVHDTWITVQFFSYAPKL